jgi:hypothetical protein
MKNIIIKLAVLLCAITIIQTSFANAIMPVRVFNSSSSSAFFSKIKDGTSTDEQEVKANSYYSTEFQFYIFQDTSYRWKKNSLKIQYKGNMFNYAPQKKVNNYLMNIHTYFDVVGIDWNWGSYVNYMHDENIFNAALLIYFDKNNTGYPYIYSN